MNSFFEQVKPGFRISIVPEKKGVSINYKAKDEPEWNPTTMLSGFETALFSLGFRISTAKAFGSEILILDEPDGACPPDYSERLFNQIINVTGFKQVFVITHKSEAVDLLSEAGAKVYLVENGEFSVKQS